MSRKTWKGVARLAVWTAMVVLPIAVAPSARADTPQTPSTLAGMSVSGTLSYTALEPAIELMVGHRARALQSPVYKPGYTLQGAWFCYGWPSGIFRCTLDWRREPPPQGGIISLDPDVVPNGLGVPARSSSGTATGNTPPPEDSGGGGSGQWAYRFRSGEFCDSLDFADGPISQWSVPPGCYATIYAPNPADYVYRPGFGWCNWWPEVLFPSDPGILADRDRGSTPVAGDVVFFDGGVQGAGSDGHWAIAVAVSPDKEWVLISEMNFTWRGGGWQRVDYRYIHVGPGVSFLY